METIQTLMTVLTSSDAAAWVAAVTAVVTAASAITALTPTKTDDKILNGVLKVLNFLSLNVLKNKNADADK